MAQKYLSIKNYEKYQTKGKEGRPWIKLYKAILGDPEFMKLSTHHRFLYTGLLLLADDCNNKIYNDRTYLGQRLYISPTEIDLKPLYRAGFLVASNLSRVLLEEIREDKEKEERREENSSALPETGTRHLSKTAATWEAYAGAYQVRYGQFPVRNAKVNGILSRLVERLGIEAVPVAAFYVSHNNPYYVQHRHPTSTLLHDAEGLRTQWATGIRATRGEAKNAEEKDEAIAQIQRVKAMMAQQKG